MSAPVSEPSASPVEPTPISDARRSAARYFLVLALLATVGSALAPWGQGTRPHPLGGLQVTEALNAFGGAVKILGVWIPSEYLFGIGVVGLLSAGLRVTAGVPRATLPTCLVPALGLLLGIGAFIWVASTGYVAVGLPLLLVANLLALLGVLIVHASSARA